MRSLVNWIVVVFVVVFLNGNLTAQVVGKLSIENAEIIGSEVFFDLVMQESPTSTGPIYLGHADFVLFFGYTSFLNPTIEKIENPNPPGGFVQNGYCSFIPTTTDGGANDILCQKSYYDGQFPTFLNSEEIIINLNSPTPNDQTDFELKMARIDAQPSIHRLGRFKITGYQGGQVQFVWDQDVPGFATKVFSLEPTTPFYSSEIELEYEDSPVLGIIYSDVDDLSNNTIQIAPNPASNYVEITITNKETIDYQLLDVHGRLIVENQITGSEVLQTAHLPGGTYFLKFTEKNKSFTKKLIIAH